MNRGDRFLLRLGFFLSGGTSLLLEIAWSKELSYVLGNTLYAVSTVVAAFMAGLGAGSYLSSRFGHRIARPIRTYAILEIVIAVLGAVSIPVIRGTEPLFGAIYGGLAPDQGVFLLVRFLAVFLLLFPAVVLMGMTLPVVIGASARRSREDSREAGQLYGINTLGAVAGTVAASFLLIPQIGLLATCVVAGVVDAIVAILAWRIDRRVGPIAAAPLGGRTTPVTAPVSSEARTGRSGGVRLSAQQWGVLGLFALSGAIAIVYEVAWFRILGLTFGPSVYAFAAMLAIYLLGVGAGSAIAGPWVQRWKAPGLVIMAGLEALLAAVGLAALLIVNQLPDLYAAFFQRLGQTIGVAALPGAQLGVAGVLVLVPCLLMGMIFPVAVRAFREAGRDGTPEFNVGRLYVWNTIGGISGSLAAGFWLLPRFGVWNTIIGASAGSLVIAVVAALLAARANAARARSGLVWIVPPVAAALAVLVLVPAWDVTAFNQGRYRVLYSGAEDEFVSGDAALIYHQEGINLSVAVYRVLGSAALHLGGKPDASTNLSDILTQSLLGHLPLLFSPQISRVGVLGYGSGMTAGGALTYPEVEELDLMEIEQGVIAASPYFECLSGDPFDDPRTRLLVEDGRVHLTYSDERYDVLISEPPNPWMAGTANLFTREFYEIVRERLTPSGVLTQWIQNYDLTEDALAAILSTLHASFPHLVIFQTNPADMIVLASMQPLRAPWDRVLERCSVPAVRASLARANVRDPLELGFFLVVPEEPAIELARTARQQNTDDNAWLEHHAPLQMMRRLFEGSRLEFASRALVARGAPMRARALAELFPGLPYEEALRALVWYPHRLEPGTIHPRFYADPWAELRQAQIPALAAALRSGAAPAGVDGAALADSVIRWELEGDTYREARAWAARSLGEARFRGETSQVLAQAAEVAPDLSLVRFEQGTAAVAAGDTAAAAAAYLSVLQSPPSAAYYYSLIGMAQLAWMAGDGASALEWADAAVDHNPYFANAFVIGAQLRLARGDEAGARQLLERGLRFNPHHSQLEEMLAVGPG